MTAGTISFSTGEDPLRATKLNAGFNERLLRAGDSMLGPLVLSRDPVLPFEASTKQYIDALVTAKLSGFLAVTGGTLTGMLTLFADPTNPLHAATKQYVDLRTGAGYISDAPIDSKTYGRAGGLWAQVLPITGGTLTGNLAVAAPSIVLGVNATAYPTLFLNGAAGSNRQIASQTAGGYRWVAVLGDTAAETGANAGSAFRIDRFADDGSSYLGTPLSINRATGQITLANLLNATGGISTTTVTASGAVTAAGSVAGNPYHEARAPVGSWKGLLIENSPSNAIRWGVIGEGTAESGSNAGTNLNIISWRDDGATTDVRLAINRATGAVAAAGALSTAGSLTNTNGRVVTSNSNAYPAYTVFDTNQGLGGSMFYGPSKVFGFGPADGSGAALSTWMWIDANTGNFVTNASITAGTLVKATTDLLVGGVAYFAYPGVTDFNISRSGGNRFFQWATGGWYDAFRESDGMRLWVGAAGTLMTLDNSSNITSKQWTSSGSASCYITATVAPTLALAGGGNSTYLQYATNLIISGQSTAGMNISMFTTSGALTYNLATTYKPGGGPWTDPSDARIKRITGDYKGGLAEILKLVPRKSIYLGNEILVTRENLAAHHEARKERKELNPLVSHHAQVAEREQEFIGFIAQEAEEAMPEMVSYTQGTIDDEFVEDLRVVDTQPLLYAMVNAFKELDARLQQLENRG